MEYPGRSDRTWEVRVFDLKENGIYYERGLNRDEAETIAKQFADQARVGRVLVCESGMKDPGNMSIGTSS